MTTQLDFTVGAAKETAYGTAATVTRFVESEAKMKFDVKTETGKGQRPGKPVNRTRRNYISRFEGSGEIACDASTRGLGFLLNAVLHAVTNTVIGATAAYQQNHTISLTDPIPTYTIQEVLPTLGGVNAFAHTFTGCAFDSLELSAKEGGTVELKFSVIARDLLTNVAAAGASYPADDDLFTFVGGSIGIAGTLTEPTTTALASLSGQPAANIGEVSVAVKRNLDSDGWNLGGQGKRSRPPVLGKPEISGKITAEYTDNTLRDAYLTQSTLPLVLTFLGPQIAAGVQATLQVVLPAIRLKGEVPSSDGGKPIKQSIDFEAFDNGVNTQPVWFVYRTLDTTP